MKNGALEPHRDEIVALYEAGMLIRELSARYDSPERTMGHFLRNICHVRMRRPHRGREPVFTKVVEDEIVAEYQHGETADSIAIRRKIDHSHVASILKRNGITRRRRTRSPELTIPEDPRTLGYLAGLIDGEGTIRTFVHDGRRKVYVQIPNTAKPLIDWLLTLGGNAYWVQRSAKWKPCGTWKVTRAIDCHRLLTAVIPGLIVKREAAEIALAALKEQWDFP